MEPLDNISSSDVLSGSFWIFTTSLVHVVLPIALATLAFSRAWFAHAAARAGDENAAPTAPLESGLVVVHGPVEHAQGAEVAVRVEITQQGIERVGKDKVLRHSWDEVDRTLQVHPFYVHDARGRVRVEPDTRTILVDDLEVTRSSGPDTRVRIAELTPGENVYVIGLLRSGATRSGGGAYRESALAPVLEPPRRGRMLVSSKPLGERYRDAARRESRWGMVIVAIAAVVFLFDLGFHMRLHTGVYERATVVDTRRVSGKSSHCAVRLSTDDGREFTDAIAYRLCPPVTVGSRLRVVRVPASTWLSQVGDAPGVWVTAFILGSFVMVFLAVFYARRARPWWERTLVETGEGPLQRHY